MDEGAATSAFQRAIASQKPQFEEFFLARFLGLTFEYVGERCIVAFELKDFMFNPQGSLHGGLIATVLDISMGHLLNHLQGPGSTLEMKTQYVKAARQGRIQCCGEFIRRGRNISFLKSTMTDEDGATVAFATATWMQLKTPAENMK
ncbi:PaaI family thioesterase [Pusillimonas sp. SM2304]|uniref:PaaI family thioesterase n=1 Tax=Pusillimonas sp. SM2304 TaxID=3073241 RepID=UPI00287472C1|nr:PaaI family thioesterase [Pusillimonas sp. SM2304]MDS1141684.1 PaaI family thioesterase [Pusillimonas sp. SM2304]